MNTLADWVNEVQQISRDYFAFLEPLQRRPKRPLNSLQFPGIPSPGPKANRQSSDTAFIDHGIRELKSPLSD